MELIAGLQPRARFFLLLVPRILTGGGTPTRMAGYAMSLADAGNHRLATWCWKRAIRSSAHDQRRYHAILDLCIRAGRQDAAAAYANRFYDGSGLMPIEAVRLTGTLALSGAFDAALSIYERLLDYCDGDVTGCSPAPAPPEPLDGHELRSMLAGRARSATSDAARAAHLDLRLARLCFSFAAFDASARLFERAGEHASTDPRDRIAHAYALLRSDRADRGPGGMERLGTAPTALTAGADWQILLATVLFARGAEGAAGIAIERAMRSRLAGHTDVERMVEDCRAMIGHLSSCPQTLTFGAGIAAPFATGEISGLRKIFVCGSGWSGSGALYDALAEYDGLAEAPNTPIDRYMNVGTDNEMTFVQGPGGLGRLWRMARDDRKLSRLDLWDMFRLHVLGGGAIGYSEHKAARVASNLVEHLGGRYTSVFRRACEGFAVLPEAAPIARLRGSLIGTTEALSAAFVEAPTTTSTSRREGTCIVFNNAIFGPCIDMLEIFHNARAAVVARDPLDQYADRRAQDLKHWMSPSRFAPLYRAAREAFQARSKQLRPELAQDVREVEFERFVRDAAYRESVIEWLLEGQNVRRVRRRFEPERSVKNIGIHAKLLEPVEREVLEKALKPWRRS
jgi:hypothetical protein